MLERAGLDATSGSPLWELLLIEGRVWLSAGMRIGYFSEGASELPTAPLEDMLIKIPPYEPASPIEFATDLALAYESITPEHIRFLYLAAFATAPEWAEALSQVSNVVEQFVHTPQSSFSPETIDEIAWFIEGPLEGYADATPKRWREGLLLVYATIGVDRATRRARRFHLGRLTDRLFTAVREEAEAQASAVPVMRVARRSSPSSEGVGDEIITTTEAAAATPVEAEEYFGAEPLAEPEAYEEE